MFRVPVSAAQPTFDDVVKVSFWGWLTSSKDDRMEWMRLRNEAAKTAGDNQTARAQAAVDNKAAEIEAKLTEQRIAHEAKLADKAARKAEKKAVKAAKKAARG